MIQVEITPPDGTQLLSIQAFYVPIGDMFRDRDGDIHLRVDGGCIMLRHSQRPNKDGVTVFNENELKDFLAQPYFANCSIVPGSVKIIAEIK